MYPEVGQYRDALRRFFFQRGNSREEFSVVPADLEKNIIQRPNHMTLFAKVRFRFGAKQVDSIH